MQEETTPYSIVLVSIDTLRADHLGFYGYERSTSPRLDQLAAESIVFDEAWTPTPWTLPSHAAMLTGVHPWELGIDNQWRTLPSEVPTIAESLSRGGYQTVAFVDSSPAGFVGAERGFDRGFDEYHHGPHSPEARQRFDVGVTVDVSLEWLREKRAGSAPFFLFLHTKSVHARAQSDPCLDERCSPYDQPPPFRLRFDRDRDPEHVWRSEDGRDKGQAYLWSLNERIVDGDLAPEDFPVDALVELVSAYDSGIRWVDTEIGRLVDGLRELDLLENTILVVTSDHGESFLDQEMFMHQELGPQNLRVPLLIRLPETKRAALGTPEPDPIALEDLTPTLLRLANLEVPGAVTGFPIGSTDWSEGNPERSFYSYYMFPGRFRFQSMGLQRGGQSLLIDNLGRNGKNSRSFWLSGLVPSLVTEEDARSERFSRDLVARFRATPAFQGEELMPVERDQHDLLLSLGYIE